MRSTFSIVLIWLLVAAGIYWGFNVFLASQYNPNTKINLSAGQGQELILKRSRDGHFRLNGLINGEPVVMMIDTGATTIAINAALAQRLNLQRGERMFSQTANGEVETYASRLSQLQFGPFEFNNVAVGVAPNMSDEVLLGMNVLKRFDISLKNEQMSLRLNQP